MYRWGLILTKGSTTAHQMTPSTAIAAALVAVAVVIPVPLVAVAIAAAAAAVGVLAAVGVVMVVYLQHHLHCQAPKYSTERSKICYQDCIISNIFSWLA